jgi:hypothetical protein
VICGAYLYFSKRKIIRWWRTPTRAWTEMGSVAMEWDRHPLLSTARKAAAVGVNGA